jgi:hypothetical protein
MKTEQLAAMNKQTDIIELRQGRVSINDIKWDLIRIIEPYDGLLDQSRESEQKVRTLFESYLRDLKIADLIQDYTVLSTMRETAVTFDISVKVSADRSAKKLKIHVGVFQPPWISKGAA